MPDDQEGEGGVEEVVQVVTGGPEVGGCLVVWLVMVTMEAGAKYKDIYDVDPVVLRRLDVFPSSQLEEDLVPGG